MKKKGGSLRQLFLCIGVPPLSANSAKGENSALNPLSEEDHGRIEPIGGRRQPTEGAIAVPHLFPTFLLAPVHPQDLSWNHDPKPNAYQFFVCTLAAFSIACSGQSKPTPLTGAWRVTEIAKTGPDASTNSNPQPGLYLFTGKHYSMVIVHGTQPRPDLNTNNTKATAAELTAAWSSFTANSGTYEISGQTLSFHPIVAKTPSVMRPSNSGLVYTFKLENKTLTLKGQGNSNAGPPTTTIKLTRVE